MIASAWRRAAATGAPITGTVWNRPAFPILDVEEDLVDADKLAEGVGNSRGVSVGSDLGGTRQSSGRSYRSYNDVTKASNNLWERPETDDDKRTIDNSNRLRQGLQGLRFGGEHLEAVDNLLGGKGREERSRKGDCEEADRNHFDKIWKSRLLKRLRWKA